MAFAMPIAQYANDTRFHPSADAHDAIAATYLHAVAHRVFRKRDAYDSCMGG